MGTSTIDQWLIDGFQVDCTTSSLAKLDSCRRLNMVILLRFSTTVGPLLESSTEDKSGLVGFATASSFEWCVDRVVKE